MGRVARFKKIRACDPYSKENRGRIALERVGVWGLGDSGRRAKKRSLTSQRLRARRIKGRKNGRGDDDAAMGGFDLPPRDEEDEFDTATMTVKKKRKPLTLDDVEAAGGRIDSAKALREAQKEEKRIHRLLKIDEQVLGPKKSAVDVPEKMPGESKNAYRKRVQAETRQIIKDTKQSYRNPQKKEKKKEFLKNKKKSKKKGQQQSTSAGGDDDDGSPTNETGDDDDVLVTAEQAVAARALDVPRFGEQAQRPPEFKSVPRGAANKKTDDQQKPKASAKRKRTSATMDDQEVQAEQQAMELMRRKVQAQYAMIRKKRRGQFHL